MLLPYIPLREGQPPLAQGIGRRAFVAQGGTAGPYTRRGRTVDPGDSFPFRVDFAFFKQKERLGYFFGTLSQNRLYSSVTW